MQDSSQPHREYLPPKKSDFTGQYARRNELIYGAHIQRVMEFIIEKFEDLNWEFTTIAFRNEMWPNGINPATVTLIDRVYPGKKGTVKQRTEAWLVLLLDRTFTLSDGRVAKLTRHPTQSKWKVKFVTPRGEEDLASPGKCPKGWKFEIGDRVKNSNGPSWQGLVVGWYSTSLTPEGYIVESEREPGNVQNLPVKGLEVVEEE